MEDAQTMQSGKGCGSRSYGERLVDLVDTFRKGPSNLTEKQKNVRKHRHRNNVGGPDQLDRGTQIRAFFA